MAGYGPGQPTAPYGWQNPFGLVNPKLVQISTRVKLINTPEGYILSGDDKEAELFATDVQLINVAGEGDAYDMADFPYGLALVAGYLRDKGVDCLLLQYHTWKGQEHLQPILDNPAYLYGFQVNFENFPQIQELVKIIKEHNPQGKIVFGGPFVVSLYEELLKNDNNLDAVVLGEGEFTIADLITKLKEDSPDWRLIPGLAWLGDDGELVTNPHRQAIQDMNGMPFAARDGIAEGSYDFEGKYIQQVRITTSRGCTSNCSFCAVNVNSAWQRARRWRGRSHVDVVDEIQELVEKYNVKLINLQDSSFDDPGTLGARRTRLFCEEILKRGLEVSMKAYFRAHSVKDDPESIELYKLYKEAGIDVLIIGTESGSDYELEIYRKDANLADNFRSFRVLDELDLFYVHNGFIMFGPYSTMKSLRLNIRFLMENERCHHWSNLDTTLILTPGAVMYEVMLKEGKVLPRDNFWEIPAYEFDDQRVVSLASHYADLRINYPHTRNGESLFIDGLNIISRLKNKMNHQVAQQCVPEIQEFTDIILRNKRIVNELSYQGFVENLNRVEQDGPNAKLVSEPYFGKPWLEAVNAVEHAYIALTDTIQAKGFGLGGLIFDFRDTAWNAKNQHHFTLDDSGPETRGDMVSTLVGL